MSKYNFINFVFAFLLIGFTTRVSAQIEQGTIILLPDVNVSIIQSKNSFYNSWNAGILLSPGYYFLNNLAISPRIGFEFESLTDDRGTLLVNHSRFSLGGNLTYMLEITEKFYIPVFLEYGYSINSLDFIRVDPGLDFFESVDFTSSNSWIFSIGTGIEYLVAKRIGIRFSLRNSLITLENSERAISQRSLSRLNGFIGFNLYFNSAHK